MADPIEKTEPEAEDKLKPADEEKTDNPEPHPTTAGLDKNPNRGQSSIPTSDELKVHVGGDG